MILGLNYNEPFEKNKIKMRTQILIFHFYFSFHTYIFFQFSFFNSHYVRLNYECMHMHTSFNFTV